MKTSILIVVSLFIISCGSQKFVETLNSVGDEFANGVELGKKAKKIMFDCDFEDDCFEEEIEELLDEECKDFEKYGLVHEKECKVTLTNQFNEIYLLNKQMMKKD